MPKDKVYKNKKEFNKANQAYSDSLNLYNNYLSAKPYFFDYSDEAKKIRDEKSAQAAVIVNRSGINPTHVQFEDGSRTPYAYFLENPPEEQYMSVFKKPTTKPVYEEVKAKPVLEPIKPLGIKPMNTSVEAKLAGNVEVPAMSTTKGATQNYTAAEALKLQGKPSGYINEGDNTGRQEFRKGGSLNDMPFGMPLKEQNPYLVPEYNQPMVGKTILPDVNRPILEGTNANEFKSTQGTDQGDVQIPTIVGGQYIGENGAWERYKATKGERFKNMTDPSSYSNFYNQVGNLGLMQSNPKQKFQQGGWLDNLK